MSVTDESPDGVVAYIGLGSNIGNRLGYLQDACQRLAGTTGIAIEAYSRVYESESVENGGEGDFLNAVLRIRTTLTPEELLAALQNVEGRMGRVRPPRTGPRTIDLDLLLYGNESIHTPNLTVPHPRMLNRRFVLLPLCDVLEGGWVRPAFGINLKD